MEKSRFNSLLKTVNIHYLFILITVASLTIFLFTSSKTYANEPPASEPVIQYQGASVSPRYQANGTNYVSKDNGGTLTFNFTSDTELTSDYSCGVRVTRTSDSTSPNDDYNGGSDYVGEWDQNEDGSYSCITANTLSAVIANDYPTYFSYSFTVNVNKSGANIISQSNTLTVTVDGSAPESSVTVTKVKTDNPDKPYKIGIAGQLNESTASNYMFGRTCQIFYDYNNSGLEELTTIEAKEDGSCYTEMDFIKKGLEAGTYSFHILGEDVFGHTESKAASFEASIEVTESMLPQDTEEEGNNQETNNTPPPENNRDNTDFDPDALTEGEVVDDSGSSINWEDWEFEEDNKEVEEIVEKELIEEKIPVNYPLWISVLSVSGVGFLSSSVILFKRGRNWWRKRRGDKGKTNPKKSSKSKENRSDIKASIGTNSNKTPTDRFGKIDMSQGLKDRKK